MDIVRVVYGCVSEIVLTKWEENILYNPIFIKLMIGENVSFLVEG